MHVVLFSLWVCLAAGWLSGVSAIAKLIGGYQWIEHTGQTRPVAMLLLLGGLCLASGLALLAMRRLPKSLGLAILCAAGIHLFNAIGLYILLSTNGHAGIIMIPFALVSAVLPTTTQFVGMPVGNASLLILPIATFVVYVASLVATPKKLARETDA